MGLVASPLARLSVVQFSGCWAEEKPFKPELMTGNSPVSKGSDEFKSLV